MNGLYAGARQFEGQATKSSSSLDSDECVKCRFPLILLALRNP